MKKLLFFILLVATNLLYGQVEEDTKPGVANSKYLTNVHPGEISRKMPITFVAEPEQADMTFTPNFTPASSENPGEEDGDVIWEKMQKAGEQKQKGVYPSTGEGVELRRVRFEVTEGFFSRLNGGCPNDNTIAISNSNRIMSMMNGHVGIYTADGRRLNLYSLERFFKNHVNDPCDPKVIYDPGVDRFFMFAQPCGKVRKNIAFGFSVSNNPNGKWYIYLFPSDYDGTGTWSDYPKIGYTKKEMFVSLRIFDSNRKYKHTVVYQMDKKEGYAGQTMTYKTWPNLPFSTTIVRSGTGIYGPGAYLVSTSSHEGSEIVLMDITDNLDNNPVMKTYHIPTDSYDVPGACSQLGSTNKLDPGDCRVQDAYYQNGIIHFVFMDNKSDWASVRYHRLNVETKNGYNYKVIHYAGTKDYTYPSISPFTNDIENQTSIVHFQATGPNSYPEMRAKVFDSDFEFQSSQLIQIGTAPMNDCYSAKRETARWGDYTGIALQYNAKTPTVWVAGSVANSNNMDWNTYIAELTATGFPIGTKEVLTHHWDIYPNPSTERIHISFESETKQGARFYLINREGVVISHLMSNVLHPGTNQFSFDVHTLPSGIYYLTIINDTNKIITNEKIVVTH